MRYKDGLPVVLKTSMYCAPSFAVVAASLVDVIGTAGLVTSSDRGGVSLALSVHYRTPAPAGTVALVVARVRQGTGTPGSDHLCIRNPHP